MVKFSDFLINKGIIFLHCTIMHCYNPSKTHISLFRVNMERFIEKQKLLQHTVIKRNVEYSWWKVVGESITMAMAGA